MTLEAAERVLARISRSASARSARKAVVKTSEPAKPGGSQKRQSVAAKVSSLSLADATLRAMRALGPGVSKDQVGDHLAKELGMRVRSNVLGRALQRHRVAGLLTQTEEGWSIAEVPTTIAGQET